MDARVGPLDGVKVLDLTRIAAGPFATMVLADLGAEVLKVERPGTGDDIRRMGTPVGNRASGLYIGLNRNKHSVALDLAAAEQRETVERLIGWADIIAENFRPGVAERLGIDYESARRINPRIIYLSISGFGPGADPGRPSFDLLGQALSGVMHITGEPDRGPSKCGAPISDLGAGTWGALGCLAALYHRAVTGEGQRVETSVLGATLTYLASYLSDHAVGGDYGRWGSRHSHQAPYQAFQGSDGRYFVLAAAGENFWRPTMTAIGLEELIDDPRFVTSAERTERRDELSDLLEEHFATKPAEVWIGELQRRGVPVSPVNTLEDVVADEEPRRSGYIVDVDQPQIGPVPVVMTPLAFSSSHVGIRRCAPTDLAPGEDVFDALLGGEAHVHQS